MPCRRRHSDGDTTHRKHKRYNAALTYHPAVQFPTSHLGQAFLKHLFHPLSMQLLCRRKSRHDSGSYEEARSSKKKKKTKDKDRRRSAKD